MKSFVGLRCLSFRTSICPIPGRSYTRIKVFFPGGPSTTSVGYNIKGFVRNCPICPTNQMIPRILQPVGPGYPLISQCTNLGPPGRWCTYLGIGSALSTGLVGGLGLKVAGIIQQETFSGCRQLAHSSPWSSCGSVLTRQSTAPAVLAIRICRPHPPRDPLAMVNVALEQRTS